MKSLSSAVLLVIVMGLVSFVIYNNRDTYSTNYKALCVSSCVKQDMTQILERGDYTYILRNKNYSNFVLKYSDYSANGAFYLTANYKDANGEIIRIKGMSFDIDKSEMELPLIGDVQFLLKMIELLLQVIKRFLSLSQASLVKNLMKH